jgi:hypothetical protein
MRKPDDPPPLPAWLNYAILVMLIAIVVIVVLVLLGPNQVQHF